MRDTKGMSSGNSFVKKITLRAIVVLLLAACFYFYEFIMQAAPGVIQQDLMRDFAIGATKIGILSGFFYLSYTPLQPFGGLLLDRYGARVILIYICGIFSLGVLLFAHAPDICTAAVARFIMGAAGSCAFISVLHLAANWVPPVRFAFFVGIAEMMGAIGGFGATEPLAIILKYTDWRTAISWFACLGIILTILIACIVRDHPSTLKSKTETRNHYFLEHLKSLLSSRETWLIGIYSFFIWAPVLGFAVLWGIKFILLSHDTFNKVTAARAVAFVWLGIAIASPIIGWLSDFIKRRCILMTICGVVGAISITIVLFVTTISAPVLFLLMFAIGFASSGQTLSFALIRDNNLLHSNSAANGFNNMAIVAGGILFQPLIGKILDLYWQGTYQDGVPVYNLHCYQMALLVLPICYFIAAITSMFFIKETYCKTECQTLAVCRALP